MTVEKQESKTWTLGQVLRWTQNRFAEAGIPSPRLDAELLLCHALGRERMALYTGYDQPLSQEELASYRELIRRRLQGASVAYLIGRKEFWTLSLKVTEAVLVPRPETEVLVEVALSLVRRRKDVPTAQEVQPGEETSASLQVPAVKGEELSVHYDQEPDEEPLEQAQPATDRLARRKRKDDGANVRIVDIGTGSGAIALALAKELPTAQILAVDLSNDALEVAKGNASRLGLSVEFFQGDLLAPLANQEPFDLIVSNPPYIPEADLPDLPLEVRCEPELALSGGPDGLVVIRKLIEDARDHLTPGGALALEVGAGQARPVSDLLRRLGYVNVRITQDLAKIQRVVSGRFP